jgi:hypothetical protein
MTDRSNTSSSGLAERILDAFPSGSYALTGLLRLLDIIETDSVATAAVECHVQPLMRINPGFVARHADTAEKLLMLVMHELHHVLLGHTTLFPRVTPAQNFVFDAVINGLLCRMFTQAPYTAFLTDYYRDDEFPECLLRPPTDWPSEDFAEVPGISALAEPLRSRAHEVHAALYSDGGASYQEVYQLLPKLLIKSGCASGMNIPLLGGHDQDESAVQDLRSASPLLFDLVRELVEQWPQPPDPIRGRSLTDVLRSSKVAPRVHRSKRSVLRDLIRKVAGEQSQGRIRQLGDHPLTMYSPILALSRRSTVLNGLGFSTLLHEGQATLRRRRPEGERVHVYLDVSGSMNGLLGPLYGVALDCQDVIHPQVHLFSSRVVDITLAELRAGRCETTGGTSIDVVAEHMERHRIRRALVVTDGWVGRPQGQHQQTLAAARLAVAYMGAQPNTDDLSAVANHCALLNSGDSK